MTWVPNDHEIEALIAADGRHRYEYFIRRVCDTRKVWGLYSDGWASLGEGDKKLIPFWPHERFAARFKTDDWSAFEPKEIELASFLERWIPGMKQERIEPAIFPVESGSAVIVNLDDLEANLRHELAEPDGEEG